MRVRDNLERTCCDDPNCYVWGDEYLIEVDDWYTDRDEIVAFVKWFLQGSGETWRCATDIFEAPWLYAEDYRGFKEDQEDKMREETYT